MIKEHELGIQEGEDSLRDDMGQEEVRDQIVQTILVKVQSFFGMIDTLKNRVRN